MEIAKDFPQKNRKCKPRVNGRQTIQQMKDSDHRKRRKNKNLIDLGHLNTEGTLDLKDLRVMVPDISKDPKYFYIIENKLSKMEIAKDIPQVNCKYKHRVNRRQTIQQMKDSDHRKRRKNKNLIDLDHLNIERTLDLKDLRVILPDISKDPKYFYITDKNKNRIEVDEPYCALEPMGSQGRKSVSESNKNVVEVTEISAVEKDLVKKNKKNKHDSISLELLKATHGIKEFIVPLIDFMKESGVNHSAASEKHGTEIFEPLLH